MIEPTRPILSRRTAVALVAGIALVTLWLNLWELRADLPAVLHSDYVQADQAVEFLRTGRVNDYAVYPVPLVFVYAATYAASYLVGHALGWGHYADWDTFLQHLARTEVNQALGRAVGAVCAALLAVAVYRLARVRFERDVAVLASAMAAFSPLQTIYSHQVRPHVPVIAIIVLVAPAVLRAALQPGFRTGLLSGLGSGVAAAVFQIGLPYAASACALIVLFARPLRVMARTLAGAASGIALGWVGLSLLTTAPWLLAEGTHRAGVLFRGKSGGLGYGVTDVFGQLGRFKGIGPLWLGAEPLCALAFVAFLVLCVLKRRSWRDVLLYGVPAATILAGIGVIHMPRPRYTMYATPFLATLAASALLAIPARPRHWLAARWAVVALFVLVPLASSIRSDVLLSRSDTRIATHAALTPLSKSGLRVVVQSDILPAVIGIPAHITLFPPNADYRPWMSKKETPRQTLLRLQPDVFIKARSATDVPDQDLQRMGLTTAFRFGGETAFIPDEPMWVLYELWAAERPGPQVMCLTHRELIDKVRLLAIAPP